MNLKQKILLIFGFCLILCIGSFIIINKMFDKIESQLLEKCRIQALVGSRVMSEIMEFMITSNILKEADLMDTNYVEIAGSNPKKYHTKYDKIFDNYIQRIEDEFLLDHDVDFAILIDRNGYVPTHNLKYSKPLVNNYDINLHQNRTKRNFSHYPAIQKSLNFNYNKSDKTSKELYFRDTGETMWAIGAPVILREKKWGIFLIGVSLERSDSIKNQMLILIITIMFVILSLTMLAVLAVIPKKYFSSDLKDTSNY